MTTTKELRNLEDLEALQRTLKLAEHTRTTIYGLPETAKALDREITHIKKRIKKLAK